MDWQIRIAILIAGLILVGYIYWDYANKKKIQQANEKLKRQFGNISNQVDGSGFDLNGVGRARVAGEANHDLHDDSENTTDDESVSIATKLENDAAAGETIDQFIQTNKDEQKSTEIDHANTVEHQSHDNKTPESDTKPLTSPKESKGLFDDEPAQDEPTQNASQPPELVFSLILQSKPDCQYTGKDFLPIFLSQGLRHGEMGIFHRHQKPASFSAKGPGPVLFSLANAIAPGTFNINDIDGFQTPALTLFMTLPCPSDAQIAYNAMVKTARLIVTELGGNILDENQSAYSEQTHNHRLDQIQEHNRKSMS